MVASPSSSCARASAGWRCRRRTRCRGCADRSAADAAAARSRRGTARPAMPPTTIASICLKECEMPSASNTAIGVSRPTKWPRKMTSMPTWNRFEPHISCLRRRSCDEPERQVYCSRSKRISCRPGTRSGRDRDTSRTEVIDGVAMTRLPQALRRQSARGRALPARCHGADRASVLAARPSAAGPKSPRSSSQAHPARRNRRDRDPAPAAGRQQRASAACAASAASAPNTAA